MTMLVSLGQIIGYRFIGLSSMQVHSALISKPNLLKW